MALSFSTTRDFFSTNLSANITAAATTVGLDSTTNLPTSGWVIIDREFSDKREIIKYTGISSLDLTGVSRGQRGTTAVVHTAGAIVEQVTTGAYIDDLATNAVITCYRRYNDW